MPKVTILMPVYNGERYLAEAIESVLNQTHEDFEFLIIDDGSIDDSISIIEYYRDQRIRLLRNTINRGLVATLNRGLRVAQGDLIARFDCDDICYPKRLELQYQFMIKNPQIAICGSAIKFFGSKNFAYKYPTDNASIRARMLFESPFAHPSVIIRRNLFLDADFFYSESVPHAEDYDFWTRIPSEWQLANLDHVLLKYRVHGNQVSKICFSSQCKNTDMVRKRLLAELCGELVSEDVFSDFCKVSRRQGEPSLSFLNNVESLLKAIVECNDIKKIYCANALKNTVGLFWWEACFHATALGFVSMKQYFSSPLSQYFSCSSYMDMVFRVKCFLKTV